MDDNLTTNPYTDDEYRDLLVARNFAARHALAMLRSHIDDIAADAGDTWSTDARFSGLQEALALLGNLTTDLLLSEQDKTRVAKLIEMDKVTWKTKVDYYA